MILVDMIKCNSQSISTYLTTSKTVFQSIVLIQCRWSSYLITAMFIHWLHIHFFYSIPAMNYFYHFWVLKHSLQVYSFFSFFLVEEIILRINFLKKFKYLSWFYIINPLSDLFLTSSGDQKFSLLSRSTTSRTINFSTRLRSFPYEVIGIWIWWGEHRFQLSFPQNFNSNLYLYIKQLSGLFCRFFSRVVFFKYFMYCYIGM